MKKSFKTGLSFGLTSGIITTLGLMVGLHSGTHSKMVIIGGILTIAIADSFSDALGIHISEEATQKRSTKAIWESTIATFVAKFIFAILFILPIIVFELKTAILVSIGFGLLCLGIFSYYIAETQKTKHWRVISEHVFIALIVIGLTHFVGDYIGKVFA